MMETCERWETLYGRKHQLFSGDVLSLYHGEDRAVSITYNENDYSKVFTNLPVDELLWVQIAVGVAQIEVIPTGP